MHRYFIEVAYDGTAFHGSQLQENAVTVQAALNEALGVLQRQPVSTFGASRTDEGVHALCNFYHFDLEAPLHPEARYKLNAILPPAVAINCIYEAEAPGLNARFDALSRRYRYRVYSRKNPFLQGRALHFPYRLDHGLLNQTAALLKDYTDFETFCKRNSQTHTFRCSIVRSSWVQEGEEWQYVVEANRFLRGMVRGLVGTQLQVARGKMSLDEFRAAIEAKDCTRAYFNVTGNGLYLEDIRYPEGALRPLPGRR